jgi:hypothetical protein
MFAVIAVAIAVAAPVVVVIPVTGAESSSVPITAPDENTFTEDTDAVPVTPEI